MQPSSSLGPDTGRLGLPDLREVWPLLSPGDRLDGLRLLGPIGAEELFLELKSREQLELVRRMTEEEQKLWLRVLPPDDAADLIQEAEPEERGGMLTLLDEGHRREVAALLAYAEDDAGGLMSTRFARVRPDMNVDEAITYLRKQARERLETIYYVYVLDAEQRLVGVVSFRELFRARPEQRVRDVMRTDLEVVRADMDQEEVSRLFSRADLIAVPVVDAEGRMQGIVTIDDVVDVVQEEATEDIQKMGGTEALEEPYLEISIGKMLRKRGIWLAVLFVGELLTATAMSFFEEEIAKMVVLALFIPLIISSGGNSGSQASTLVIRAMALGEVHLRDALRVVRRELASGLGLGALLGALGVLRILLWEAMFGVYGAQTVPVAITIGLSLLGVVMFGTLVGSTLPLLLRRLGLDPASASAPFVATLVDVTGLLIYFGIASVVLQAPGG